MVWVVTTITFAIIRNMPGDPIQAQYEQLIAQGATPESAAAQTAVLHRFRPDGSVLEQYLDYMWSLLRFDLGQSMSTGVAVTDVISDAAKWTIIPILLGTLLSFLLGITMGVYAALRRSGHLADALTMTGSILRGLPDYVVALLLASIFATLWPILPRSGSVDIMEEPGWNLGYLGSLAEHAVLPVVTYALSAYGGWILAMRSSVVTVLGDDFILAAELRGVTRGYLFRYVARNAILPLFTILALSLGTLFGGAIFIERIFNYPGLGYTIIESIGNRDFTLMGGVFLLITVAIIIANIVADLLYSMIDPRVRREADAS